MELTVEQQFAIKAFKVQAKSLSREDAQRQLIELYTELIVKENIYKELIKKQWGV
jgi:hypothetical protein